jgi:hypothetical protein
MLPKSYHFIYEEFHANSALIIYIITYINGIPKKNKEFCFHPPLALRSAPPATLLCYRYAEGAERVGGRERPAPVPGCVAEAWRCGYSPPNDATAPDLKKTNTFFFNIYLNVPSLCASEGCAL